MIVVQEVHDVAGRDEDAFDLALRDSWAPALAESGEARLVWALRQAHGTGASYRVITPASRSDWCSKVAAVSRATATRSATASRKATSSSP